MQSHVQRIQEDQAMSRKNSGEELAKRAAERVIPRIAGVQNLSNGSCRGPGELGDGLLHKFDYTIAKQNRTHWNRVLRRLGKLQTL